MRLASVGGAVVAVTTGTDPEDGWIASGPDFAVAFSGVLDNARSLAAAWVKGEHEAPRASPAEIIAAGTCECDVETVARRLRGVFAVVVTDGRILWSFRDQLGFHPIVYREDARGAFIATEAKQIVAGSGIRSEPDLDVLEKIFYGGLGGDPRCAISGIRRLEPAAVLRIEAGRIALSRYWDPEPLLETTRLPSHEIRERFLDLMEQAAGRCLTGRDAVSLSGGVDSPAVAAFAAPLHLRRTGRPLTAVSAVFPEHPSVNEAGYVESVARELGMPLRTYRPSVRPTDDLGKWVRLLDGPVPVVAFSQINELLEVARDLGIRSVLTGEMEEFVFEMRTRVFGYLVTRGRFGSSLEYARARRGRGASLGGLVRMYGAAVTPDRIRRALRSSGGEPGGDTPPWIAEESVEKYRATRPPRSWRSAQLVAFEGSGLSLDADDTIQALAGVRERRPFADIDLWEFGLGLRAEVKHGNPRPKAFIRDLLRGKVPDIVLDRTDKTVFDRFISTNIDYGALRRWLLDPAGPPMPGVRYDLLADRLKREAITLREFMWAKDLASVHAFLSLWENEETPRT